MAVYHTIALSFKSGLHLSKGKENNYDKTQSFLHSDTLKSALFVAGIELFGADAMSKDFLESFRISSCFPYLKKEEQFLYFLPRPLMVDFQEQLSIFGSSEQDQVKLVKKIAFIEKDLLCTILEKGNATVDKTMLTKDGSFVSRVMDLDAHTILDTSPQQHVTVDRLFEADANPYVIDKLYFEADAGLYFLIDTKQEVSLLKKLTRLLEYLGDCGIGTDKHSGSGQFEIMNVGTMDLPAEGNRQMALSLYCPDKTNNYQELAGIDKSEYELIRRGGYIANPANPRHLVIRKRSVYMFKEGSVFPYLPNRRGDIVDLRPDASRLKAAAVPMVKHAIYRDGQAIFLSF